MRRRMAEAHRAKQQGSPRELREDTWWGCQATRTVTEISNSPCRLVVALRVELPHRRLVNLPDPSRVVRLTSFPHGRSSKLTVSKSSPQKRQICVICKQQLAFLKIRAVCHFCLRSKLFPHYAGLVRAQFNTLRSLFNHNSHHL